MSLQHEMLEETAGEGAEDSQTSADVAAMQRLLLEEGLADWDPVVVGQLLDIANAHVTRILKTAKTVAQHCGKERIDENDVAVAMDFNVQSHIDRNRLHALSVEKNAHPLPNIRHNFGLKLPNDRFCLLQPNYTWKGETPTSSQEDTVAAPVADATTQQLKPEHVVNLLRRKPDEDFDS